jgi:hypothetical protein
MLGLDHAYQTGADHVEGLREYGFNAVDLRAMIARGAA